MPVLYRKQGHTGILTLSRPEARNCWGQDYNCLLYTSPSPRD